MHSLALKVRREWSLAIWSVKECLVAVCAESTGKHADVPEDALSKFGR